MTRLPFSQIDAFSDRPFGGNPAAVMPLDAWLPDETLRGIAAEHNLSETAFLLATPDGPADHELRWFTPMQEIALCGHATLASGHFLLAGDTTRDRVTFATRRSGILAVERAAGGYRLDLPAIVATPHPLPDAAAAMRAAPVETLWNERGYALLVYRTEAEVRALAPDMRALAALGDTLFVATAPGDDTDIASRVFVPGAGVDEDPVTGSAHAVLTPYWTARLGKPAFSALQASARGGRLDCTLAGDRVSLAGACFTVIEGVMHL